jgi:hypothetical protein
VVCSSVRRNVGVWNVNAQHSTRRPAGNVLYGLLPYFSESFGEQLQRQTRPFPCEKTLQVGPAPHVLYLLC